MLLDFRSISKFCLLVFNFCTAKCTQGIIGLIMVRFQVKFGLCSTLSACSSQNLYQVFWSECWSDLSLVIWFLNSNKVADVIQFSGSIGSISSHFGKTQCKHHDFESKIKCLWISHFSVIFQHKLMIFKHKSLKIVCVFRNLLFDFHSFMTEMPIKTWPNYSVHFVAAVVGSFQVELHVLLLLCVGGSVQAQLPGQYGAFSSNPMWVSRFSKTVTRSFTLFRLLCVQILDLRLGSNPSTSLLKFRSFSISHFWRFT
jgi:hypothetical protein